MRLLPLSVRGQNKYQAIVDDDDYERVAKHSWCYSHGYAQSRIKGVKQYLHRFILQAAKGTLVDHINRNMLDNRKCNLRFATKSQNGINARKSRRGSSRYKGVSWDKLNRNWKAQIGFHYKHIYIGTFATEKAAALAYRRKAQELHKTFLIPK